MRIKTLEDNLEDDRLFKGNKMIIPIKQILLENIQNNPHYIYHIGTKGYKDIRPLAFQKSNPPPSFSWEWKLHPSPNNRLVASKAEPWGEGRYRARHSLHLHL